MLIKPFIVSFSTAPGLNKNYHYINIIMYYAYFIPFYTMNFKYTPIKLAMNYWNTPRCVSLYCSVLILTAHAEIKKLVKNLLR